MRKRLQIVLMAAFSTSIPLTSAGLYAGTDDLTAAPITASDENGRKIYVNESAPRVRHSEAPETPRRPLMYWSAKDSRWKPVPPPNAATMKAARSAAAEVSQYFNRESTQSANAKIQAANSNGVPSSPQ